MIIEFRNRIFNPEGVSLNGHGMPSLWDLDNFVLGL